MFCLSSVDQGPEMYLISMSGCLSWKIRMTSAQAPPISSGPIILRTVREKAEAGRARSKSKKRAKALLSLSTGHPLMEPMHLTTSAIRTGRMVIWNVERRHFKSGPYAFPINMVMNFGRYLPLKTRTSLSRPHGLARVLHLKLYSIGSLNDKSSEKNRIN